MATTGWRENQSLRTLVYAHHARFNVFQLMRLLMWQRSRSLRAPSQGGAPAMLRVDQRLRFRGDLSSAFPGREISGIALRPAAKRRDTSSKVISELGANAHTASRVSLVKHDTETLANEHLAGDGAVELLTPNFCVAGNLGPLPEPYTEWIREMSRSRVNAMAEFLNIYNQRLNVLRFHLKTRQTLALNNAHPEETSQARYLASMMGMAHPKIARQLPLPRRTWLGMAGLLANVRRSASAVTTIMGLYVGSKVQLEQYVGAWQHIEASNQIGLGRQNSRLGAQTALGRHVWDPQARVRLTIPALAFADFCALLPGFEDAQQGKEVQKEGVAKTAAPLQKDAGSADEMAHVFAGFVTLLRLALDRQCDCEVVLEADPVSVRPRALTAQPERNIEAAQFAGLRLGQTAWLQRAPSPAGRPYRAAYLVPAFDAMGAA